MKRAMVALAVLMLAGCASILDDMYDDQARRDCDQAGGNRSDCYDRVEQNRRERDRDR